MISSLYCFEEALWSRNSHLDFKQRTSERTVISACWSSSFLKYYTTTLFCSTFSSMKMLAKQAVDSLLSFDYHITNFLLILAFGRTLCLHYYLLPFLPLSHQPATIFLVPSVILTFYWFPQQRGNCFWCSLLLLLILTL